jgi:hypothetical protein
MRYKIFGPFNLPTDGSTRHYIIDEGKKKEFWKKIDEVHPELRKAKGCYIFGIKAKLFIPWYVGKAVNQSFETESWSIDKLHKFNKILQEKRGYPFLFLIAKVGASDKLTKAKKTVKINKKTIGKKTAKTKLNEIDRLETFFIREAYRINKDLYNVQKLHLEKNITIEGYLNSTIKRRNESESEFTKMMS